MEWLDRGIVLSARRHGESSAVASVLTENHGRHAGLVRGAAGKRAGGLLEPGNEVSVRWRARLEEHLGNFTLELLHSHAATILGDPLQLSCLAAACAVAEAALPERERHGAVYRGLRALLNALEEDGDERAWQAAYVRWERDLLRDLGFGLDLAACAATGATDRLAFVSPRTGRAVSEAAGAPYRDRLLPLPAFLRAEDAPLPTRAEALAGLALTGHFLEAHVFAPHGRAIPAARTRLIDRLSRPATIRSK